MLTQHPHPSGSLSILHRPLYRPNTGQAYAAFVADHVWNPASLGQIAASALEARSLELRLEQAVHRLDSLEEVGFHPLVAAGLADAGFGVFREVPYPGEPARRPRHAERLRCDLVLTPARDIGLRDPVAELRSRDDASGTLFAPLAESLSVCPGIEPRDAFWMEIKLVGQFCYTAGVPGPNRTYASELLRLAAGDIPKLAADRLIHHAALLVILFTADRATADHDLAAFVHRGLDHDLPISTPSMFRFAIDDVIGNSLCTVCIVPVRQDPDRS